MDLCLQLFVKFIELFNFELNNQTCPKRTAVKMLTPQGLWWGTVGVTTVSSVEGVTEWCATV